MTVITAANQRFAHVIGHTAAANVRAGYSPLIFPVPDSYAGHGDAEEFCAGKSPWKPDLLLRALTLFGDDVLWLDADAWVIRPVKSLCSLDCDIAVTLRPSSEQYGVPEPLRDMYGYINAGVIFARPTNAAKSFIARWIQYTDMTGTKSDQHALNILCNPWNYNIGDTVDIYGARVHFLSTREWNFYYCPEEPLPQTKILHFKTDTRHRADLQHWCGRNFA